MDCLYGPWETKNIWLFVEVCYTWTQMWTGIVSTRTISADLICGRDTRWHTRNQLLNFHTGFPQDERQDFGPFPGSPLPQDGIVCIHQVRTKCLLNNFKHRMLEAGSSRGFCSCSCYWSGQDLEKPRNSVQGPRGQGWSLHSPNPWALGPSSLPTTSSVHYLKLNDVFHCLIGNCWTNYHLPP